MATRKKTSTKKTARRAPVRETLPVEERVMCKGMHHVAPSPLGRPRIYQTPEEMLKRIQGYFAWAEANPLYEAKLVTFQGKSTMEKLPKLRALTLDGMCLFLGLPKTTFQEYRKRSEFSYVIQWAEDSIREQKFGAAAADLMNANIIALDLGLRAKEAESSDTAQALAKLLQALSGSLPD